MSASDNVNGSSKNSVKVIPQPRTRNKNFVDEDLVGGSYSVSSDELDEILVTLRKLDDANKWVKERVSTIDDQVRHTQLDLENLVSRSSNNNKHLQSLLLSSEDIKELHESLQTLTIQQEKQLEQNQGMESVLGKLIERQTGQLTSRLESERIKDLEEKLSRYEQKNKRLEDLDLMIISKEKELKRLETYIGHLEMKYKEREEDFQKLRQRTKDLQDSIQNDLVTRYKTVQNAVSVSMCNLGNSTKPAPNASRVASLLRNKYMDDKFNQNRRVISLSENTSSRKSYDMLVPQNNSDIEDT